MNKYNIYEDSILVLQESSTPSFKEVNRIINVLEDAESPMNKGYIKAMMESIDSAMLQSRKDTDITSIRVKSGNIDDIPDIKRCIDVLISVKNMSQQNGFKIPIEDVDDLLELVENLRQYSDVYQRGYTTKCRYVMTEYITLVAFIITSTSVILNSYTYIDELGKVVILDRPIKHTMSSLTSTRRLAKKFNNVFADTRTNHRKFLEALIMKETDHFIGSSTALGIGVVAAGAIAVVPLTRELVYQFYKYKASISDCLAQQAYFLELNKASVENNTAFTPKKRAEIIKKQEKVRNLFLKISSKLRVDHAQAVSQAKQMMDRDNKTMTLDNIEQEINQSSLQLF